MIVHAPIHLLFIDQGSHAGIAGWRSFLRTMTHVRVTVQMEVPRDFDGYDAVISSGPPLSEEEVRRLTRFVRDGHGWLVLVSPEEGDLPEGFGVRLTPADPALELRVLFDHRDHPLGRGLPDAIYLRGRHRRMIPADGTTEVVLYADWKYDHSPVLVHRPLDAGQMAATVLEDLGHPVLQRILYRLLVRMAGQTRLPGDTGVGILGYAPSVGRLHGLGAQAAPGLTLSAVCDLDPRRRDQAHTDFPDIARHGGADEMAADDSVQLVIVATPPNSHADLALKMMEAGKHVVCEKPLALNRKETGRMAALAREHRLLLCCHQNRRFDPDYLAIKGAVDQGRIGDLFHLETFVGAFHHPCGYWHSHAPICGGTTYDWGAHYLDWIVGLMGTRIDSVQGMRHNRVWHDVTNADQERIFVRFADGREAEFIHSDIAAAPKPKWYLLGTEGAVVGHWRDVTSYLPHEVHYFETHEIPVTEMPPRLTLHIRQNGGEVVQQNLALPPRSRHAFHRNLADHLVWGEPLAAPLEDSMQVVAILEAAARSMSRGGTVEVLDE